MMPNLRGEFDFAQEQILELRRTMYKLKNAMTLDEWMQLNELLTALGVTLEIRHSMYSAQLDAADRQLKSDDSVPF